MHKNMLSTHNTLYNKMNLKSTKVGTFFNLFTFLQHGSRGKLLREL